MRAEWNKNKVVKIEVYLCFTTWISLTRIDGLREPAFLIVREDYRDTRLFSICEPTLRLLENSLFSLMKTLDFKPLLTISFSH
uniref:Uncharacterized protein n=1 Tax=Utricularia reniformis TaxID=192314 RepID=A0A1Y0B1V4_9LAMI|nr:hypothetical protein AEK19_MT1123 [Utricularia reniformis]ART31339.1 hypothetical protein AEK19_MT1123 [Utricularia reniformis]